MSDRPAATDWLLPPDIEVIIIDHCLDDKHTLVSCSLVCSRWLPRSRKHLFKDITIKSVNHLTPDPLANFLRIVERPGVVNPEWAIGNYIKTLSLDGRFTDQEFDRGSLLPTVPCALSILRALLAILPRLTSLCVAKVLILDDTPQRPDAEDYHFPPFGLAELSISRCSGPTEDPHPLLALICTFSRIGSLSVGRWGEWRPNPRPTFSQVPFSVPAVRSFVIDQVSDLVASRALHALLSSSPSLADGSLTSLSCYAGDCSNISMFVALVNLAGTILRNVELRVVDPEIRPYLLREILLPTCTALSSFTLSFQGWFMQSFLEDAEDTRNVLGLYTALLRTHCNIFVRLKTVRLEMRPVGQYMLTAFIRVAQDIFFEKPENVVRAVLPPEAEQNRAVWEFLEDALCNLPALECVELVLYETSRPDGTLTKAAKGELREALEGRLPRLWPNGTAQLVFETDVDDA